LLRIKNKHLNSSVRINGKLGLFFVSGFSVIVIIVITITVFTITIIYIIIQSLKTSFLKTVIAIPKIIANPADK
jgi:hypothetical protein